MAIDNSLATTLMLFEEGAGAVTEFPPLSRLVARGQAALFQLLRSDLQFCKTYVALAEIALMSGHLTGARQARAIAEKSYAIVARMVVNR
jgi:hypothetical protein